MLFKIKNDIQSFNEVSVFDMFIFHLFIKIKDKTAHPRSDFIQILKIFMSQINYFALACQNPKIPYCNQV